jgi:hypothetical protein
VIQISVLEDAILVSFLNVPNLVWHSKNRAGLEVEGQNLVLNQLRKLTTTLPSPPSARILYLHINLQREILRKN